MAHPNESTQEVSHETFHSVARPVTEDLLVATIASACAASVPVSSAAVIAHPMGGAVRVTPLGGRKKRAFDLLAALLIVILASPLLVMVALAVFFQGGGQIVFAHKRVGFRGREFPCLKFRTMVVNSDEKLAQHLAANPAAALEWSENRKLRHDPRVTWIGHFLRKTSLDELPQLINVLRGEMSLVGPRPIVAEELTRYGRHRSAYLSVRPGMTGLWQVSGRSTTTYERRAHLDAAYIRSWRLIRDLKIVFRTIPEVMMSSRTS